MNPELSHIAARCHYQDLLRAAQREHLADAAQNARSGRTRRVVHLRTNRRRRVLAIRTAVFGRA